MSGSGQHKPIITATSSRLFDDDDDIDDSTFLANAPLPLSPPHSGSSGGVSPPGPLSPGAAGEQRLEQLRLERQAIEKRSLLSTEASLRLLAETEHVGQDTAEELVRQREQLQHTNVQLDTIRATLRTSQKHINGLRSVFSGVRNYLSGNSAPAAAPAPTPANGPRSDSDSSSGAASPTYDGHPVARLRGHVEEQPESFERMMSNDRRLDENIDMMASSLSRLKDMAIGLNTEIEAQNELIDTIHNKVDDVDEKITRQNRDIRHMLKK